MDDQLARYRKYGLVLFLLPFGLFCAAFALPEAGNKKVQEKEEPVEAPKNPFPDRDDAPSLDGGVEWLNTSGEITLKDLRGKIVLLDFWTYCCINCMHVLPDLEFLEKKYPDQLVVIGVHSAKFDNEKETENIRRAIMRYEIEHPVINDANMTVWRKFGVRAWPTLVMIDPEGKYCGYISGEGNREILDKLVSMTIEYHRHNKTLDETPVRFDLESKKAAPKPLKFPGKLLVDEPGGRLFISDSNHNRIVVSSLDGKLLEMIGTGKIGQKNGSYSEASFDHPQGIALTGNRLYVADTENHMIREIDLEKKTVRTLAGLGVQSRERFPVGETLTASETPLASPWDLSIEGEKLYIAMAGPHQIWVHDFSTGRIGPFSGSGREDVRNGAHAEAAYAQPSGMVSDGEFLYAADSEGSAVRKIPLDPDGEATTIAGTSDLFMGRSLFEFGDRDGIGEEVRLQHPLGLAYAPGKLFIADSYNHKIKTLDLKTNETKTLIGTGAAGDKIDPIQFNEPAGLAVAGSNLYIADTNNHRILKYDLNEKKASVFEIEGLKPTAPPRAESDDTADQAIEIPKVKVQGENLIIEHLAVLPEGYKLNPEFTPSVKITGNKEQTLLSADQLGVRHEAKHEGDKLSVSIPIAKLDGAGVFEITLNYGYCRGGKGGLCKLQRLTWKVPIEASSTGEQAILLEAP